MDDQHRRSGTAGKPLPSKDPFADDMATALKVGAASGAVGFLFGGAVGIIRNLPPFLSAGATSLQTLGFGTVLTQTRLTIIRAWTTEEQKPSPKELISASAIAGGFTGGTMGAILRGRSNILPGAIMWTIFGATGQLMYNQWAATLNRMEDKSPGFWKRMSEKSWTPFKVLSNEEYADMLKEKMLKVEVEMSILDDKIAALKEKERTENAATPSET